MEEQREVEEQELVIDFKDTTERNAQLEKVVNEDTNIYYSITIYDFNLLKETGFIMPPNFKLETRIYKTTHSALNVTNQSTTKKPSLSNGPPSANKIKQNLSSISHWQARDVYYALIGKPLPNTITREEVPNTQYVNDVWDGGSSGWKGEINKLLKSKRYEKNYLQAMFVLRDQIADLPNYVQRLIDETGKNIDHVDLLVKANYLDKVKLGRIFCPNVAPLEFDKNTLTQEELNIKRQEYRNRKHKHMHFE